MIWHQKCQIFMNEEVFGYYFGSHEETGVELGVRKVLIGAVSRCSNHMCKVVHTKFAPESNDWQWQYAREEQLPNSIEHGMHERVLGASQTVKTGWDFWHIFALPKTKKIRCCSAPPFLQKQQNSSMGASGYWYALRCTKKNTRGNGIHNTVLVFPGMGDGVCVQEGAHQKKVQQMPPFRWQVLGERHTEGVRRNCKNPTHVQKIHPLTAGVWLPCPPPRVSVPSQGWNSSGGDKGPPRHSLNEYRNFFVKQIFLIHR